MSAMTGPGRPCKLSSEQDRSGGEGGGTGESVVAVIPARWASTRFPGKPLAPLAGEPMIAHVVRRAAAAKTVDHVIVATDDERICEAAIAAGAEAVMTGDCASGTDRIAAALSDRGRHDWCLAINVQGDEPLLSGANIDVLVEGMLAAPEIPIGTLCRPLAAQRAEDANAVKVVVSASGRALYFSRSMIPYPRDCRAAASLWRLHLGIYAYRPGALRRFVALGCSTLERAEGLEQLRALEHDMDILVLDAPDDAFGVDTPEDLQRAEAELRAAGEHRRATIQNGAEARIRQVRQIWTTTCWCIPGVFTYMLWFENGVRGGFWAGAHLVWKLLTI